MGEVIYVYVYKKEFFYDEEFDLLNPKPALPKIGKDGTALNSFDLIKKSTCPGHTTIVIINIDNDDLFIRRCCKNFGIKNKRVQLIICCL